MSSEKQIQANRRNALKGGPKTEEGKAKVRLNAVSHGFFSKEDLAPGEDRALLAEIREEFMKELRPVGAVETFLVELVVSSSWRLRRVINNEAKHITSGADYRFDSWQNILRHTAALERRIYRALHELQKVQKSRLGSQPLKSASSVPLSPAKK
jgi:hypothetical protein